VRRQRNNTTASWFLNGQNGPPVRLAAFPYPLQQDIHIESLASTLQPGNRCVGINDLKSALRAIIAAALLVCAEQLSL
jgi:hypothetical protein